MARIIVLDDDILVRKAISQALKHEGHDVFQAANWIETVEECRSGMVNLVLTDIFMPDKDGFDVIQELHQEFPDLPILAFSGWHPTSGATLKMARHIGATDVFELPFDVHKLTACVARVLAQSGKQ